MADIDKLKRIVDSKGEERSRHTKLQEWLYGRANEIKAAAVRTQTDFWCDTCKRDFSGIGHKQVRMPPGSVWFAYYATVCPVGHKALRYITDKLTDPYYVKSARIRREQGLFHDDMLSPAHPRFKLIYPNQYRRLFLKEKGVVL